MSDEIIRLNPYVGPRAFETGEKIYGRDREVRDLLNFLLSQRIVLLFSPSGAGKTSLIRAGLIPSLQERGLQIRRVIRMNVEPDSHPLEGADSPTPNRYVLSTLVSLEEEQADELRFSPSELAGLSLQQYLEQRATQDTNSDEGQPKRELLIFDQFEEILTLDPTDLPAKVEFFSQLGDCLDERRRFALFSIREDFIAGLDPYLRHIPTHLDHRYRLDLLGVEAASSAIQRPAKERGVTFTPPAARKLVDDLRRVQVQRPDGSLEELPGPYVEPVQLQVVCFRLWQNLASGQDSIGEEDVLKAGDVNQSLANYYRECITRIAGSPGEERLIRLWFDRQLITEQGFRGQVLVGPGGSSGVSRQAIDALDHAYLIRGEKRRGASWYELAHDRLVEPVRRDNATWFQENLSLLQRQAEIWEKENRPEHLLLREQALADAQEWANQHAGEMTEDEQAFLQDSLEADRREREAQEAKQRYERSLRRRLIAASLAALAALLLGAIAFSFGIQSRQQSLQIAKLAEQNATSADIAKTNAVIAQDNERTAVYNQHAAQTQEALAAKAQQTAEAASTDAYLKAIQVKEAQSTAQANADQALQSYSAQLAAQGQQVLNDDPRLAALLGVEAIRIKDTFAARDLLLASLEKSQQRQLAQYSPVIQADQSGQSIPITNLAASPNGEDLAWGLGSGLVQIYNLSQRGVVDSFDTKGNGAVSALAFSQQSPFSILAYADARGDVYLRNLASKDPNEDNRYKYIKYPNVRDLAFHPHKLWLAVVTIRNVFILDIPHFWETYDASKSVVQHFSQPVVINSIAWSPDGRYLATGSGDRRVRVWDAENGELKVIGELNGEVSSVAWSPDGSLLAAASLAAQLSTFQADDRQIVVWSYPDGAEVKDLNVHGFYKANSLSFSPDGHVLASAGDEGAVVFVETGSWEVLGRYQFNYTGINPPRRDDVEELAFFPTPGLSLLAAAQYGGQVALTTINPVQSMAYDVVSGLEGAVIGLDVNPDGDLSAVVTQKSGSGMYVMKVPSLQQAQLGRKAEQGVYIPGNGQVAVFSPDHRLLALGDPTTPVISVYDPETGSLVYSKNISAADPSSPVYDVAFSSDGSRLAALLCAGKPGEDGCDESQRLIRVIDTASGELIGSAIRGPEPPSVTSADLKGIDKIFTLYRLDFESSTLLIPFDLSWSAFVRGPDDSWFASASEVAALYLWDAAHAAQLGLPLTGSPATIRSLAFNKGEMMLYTGLSNGAIQAWSMLPEEWKREACLAANRNLTDKEWEKYFPGQVYRPTCQE